MSTQLPPERMPKADRTRRLRSKCRGVMPLPAYLRPWMVRACEQEQLRPLVERFGSPLNVHDIRPFFENIGQLRDVAADRHIDFSPYFARKANKCLSFVDAAVELDCGADTASLPELEQALDRGIRPGRTICTAAIKDVNLFRRCVAAGVTVAADNLDELRAMERISKALRRPAKVALRVGGFRHAEGRLDSRFGFDIAHVNAMLGGSDSLIDSKWLELKGVHFHLDGYLAAHRISAIRQSLALIDRLRHAGHGIDFLDIGGGIPMNYLDSRDTWDAFWREHRRALTADRAPLTYRNHGLGLTAIGSELHGAPRCYPFFQSLVQGDWLASILDAPLDRQTVATAVRERSLQLRCEPGRSVLDGCGMTAAQVVFRKRHRDGYWLIGLAMNRTQCRTSSDDFLVDPLLVSSAEPTSSREGSPIEGFLVGAYCTESELLSLRRLQFPAGVEIGDLVVFPNTAGYFMHFLESRSHQFPLARNVFLDADSAGGFRLDAIDAGGSAGAVS